MNIIVTSPSFSKHPILQTEIKSAFPNVTLNLTGRRYNDPASLITYIGDAEGVVVGLEPITEEVLRACPNLKIVAKYGVGLDNIDQKACEKHGVKIGWTGGVNRLSVAEMTLGFMLGLGRNLYPTSLQLKSGTWNKSGGFQLTGKSVGIVGVGHIGKELIRLLEPFKCEILVNDVIDQSEYYASIGAKSVDKETLFKRADIVTIHTPLTSSTRHMINASTLELMKKSAVVINTARGGIVDQDALKSALEKGVISAAALDVFEEEPPRDEALLALPNLFCTPHIGGNAYEAVEAMGMSAIGHLKVFFDV